MSDGTPEDELPDAESEATSDDEQRGKDLRSENSEARDPGRGGLKDTGRALTSAMQQIPISR